MVKRGCAKLSVRLGLVTNDMSSDDMVEMVWIFRV